MTAARLDQPEAGVPGQRAPLDRCAACRITPGRIVRGNTVCWWCQQAIEAHRGAAAAKEDQR